MSVLRDAPTDCFGECLVGNRALDSGTDSFSLPDVCKPEKTLRVGIDAYIKPYHPRAMKSLDLKVMARSPSAAVVIGLVSALVLGSLATAGLNTIGLARLMIGLSALLSSVYLFSSSSTSSWRMRTKVFAVACVLLIHLGIERTETWGGPAPVSSGGMPFPPLLLMLGPTKLGYAYPLVDVPKLSLAVGYIARPTGGYAAFGKIGDNESDDVMFGIDNVIFLNRSANPLRLSWTLTIRGEGKVIELSGSGKGRWERQLNVNDYFAAKEPSPLSWMLSPIELAAHSRTPITSAIGFVAPQADAGTRGIIRLGQLPPEYSAILNLKNDTTGVVARLPLPFGRQPVPAEDPTSRLIRQDSGEQ